VLKSASYQTRGRTALHLRRRGGLTFWYYCISRIPDGKRGSGVTEPNDTWHLIQQLLDDGLASRASDYDHFHAPLLQSFGNQAKPPPLGTDSFEEEAFEEEASYNCVYATLSRRFYDGIDDARDSSNRTGAEYDEAFVCNSLR